MKVNSAHTSLLGRFRKDQRGQVLPLVAMWLTVLLGLVGLVVDFGDVYFSYQKLVVSTNAAALAGAATIATLSADSVAMATSYSGVAGNKNATLPNVTMVSGYPQLKCLATLVNQGIPCLAALGAGAGGANAIVVKQTTSVPMFFAQVIGAKTVTLTATATGAMKGGSSAPTNLAIVLDTTASMNSQDTGNNCKSSKITCALQGVQTLLLQLSPTVGKVSLYTFPGVTAASAKNDYNCSGSSPTITGYSYPTLPTYQIVPYGNDYRSSATSTTLAGSSNLVAAVGGKSGCSGMQAIGGAGTYFAAAIYKAQADLLVAQAANSGSQNALIILSDGDASSSNMPGASTTKPAKGVAAAYESTYDECQQAITAAQSATAAGTTVFTIAYGAASGKNSGCSTDTTGPLAGIDPCTTMQMMASAAGDFYSDTTGTCVAGATPITNLKLIFGAIASNFTFSRLIPNNTT